MNVFPGSQHGRSLRIIVNRPLENSIPRSSSDALLVPLGGATLDCESKNGSGMILTNG